MTIATPGSIRVLEHQLLVYRRVWKSNVLGSVIRPLLYLLGMGIGVGRLVDDGPRGGQLLDDLTYFQFFAPAMIATTAMLVLTNDALWPIRDGFMWNRAFLSQVAAPISPGEVVGGVLLWNVAKGILSSMGVAVALLLFDSTRTWGLIPAVLFGALSGVAYSAPLIAWSASRETDLSFPNINRFVIVPMFLFSGAFYPITELPGWLQVFSKITPIWHGVELCRGATYGTLSLAKALVHIGFSLLWIFVGWVLARRVFTQKLGV